MIIAYVYVRRHFSVITCGGSPCRNDIEPATLLGGICFVRFYSVVILALINQAASSRLWDRIGGNLRRSVPNLCAAQSIKRILYNGKIAVSPSSLRKHLGFQCTAVRIQRLRFLIVDAKLCICTIYLHTYKHHHDTSTITGRAIWLDCQCILPPSRRRNITGEVLLCCCCCSHCSHRFASRIVCSPINLCTFECAERDENKKKKTGTNPKSSRNHGAVFYSSRFLLICFFLFLSFLWCYCDLYLLIGCPAHLLLQIRWDAVGGTGETDRMRIRVNQQHWELVDRKHGKLASIHVGKSEVRFGTLPAMINSIVGVAMIFVEEMHFIRFAAVKNVDLLWQRQYRMRARIAANTFEPCYYDSSDVVAIKKRRFLVSTSQWP